MWQGLDGLPSLSAIVPEECGRPSCCDFVKNIKRFILRKRETRIEMSHLEYTKTGMEIMGRAEPKGKFSYSLAQWTQFWCTIVEFTKNWLTTKSKCFSTILDKAKQNRCVFRTRWNRVKIHRCLRVSLKGSLQQLCRIRLFFRKRHCRHLYSRNRPSK